MPILSENTCNISTRFGKSGDFIEKIEAITKKKIVCSIEETETIGPNSSLEVMIIAPCTGNTLAKLAHGITDTYVILSLQLHFNVILHIFLPVKYYYIIKKLIKIKTAYTKV